MLRILVISCWMLASAGSAWAQEQLPAFLGVGGQPINAELREQYSIPQTITHGFVVSHVHKGTAAEKAGFKVGDLILRVDGKEIVSFEDLAKAIRSQRPGANVNYMLRRGNEEVHGQVTLGEYPTTDIEKVREFTALEFVRPGDELRGVQGQALPKGIERRLDQLERAIAEIRQEVQARMRRHVEAQRAQVNAVHRARAAQEAAAVAQKKAHADAVRAAHAYQARAARGVGTTQTDRLTAVERRMDGIESKLDAILELLKTRKNGGSNK
ncbi:MAG: PDZ domain-containing protein [Planctomycetota bacterium]